MALGGDWRPRPARPIHHLRRAGGVRRLRRMCGRDRRRRWVLASREAPRTLCPRLSARPPARGFGSDARRSLSILPAAHLPRAPAASCSALRICSLRQVPALPACPPRAAAGPGRSAAEGEGRPERGPGRRGDDEQIPKVAVQTQGERLQLWTMSRRRAFPPPVTLSCRSLLDKIDLVFLALYESLSPVHAMPFPCIPRLGQTMYLTRIDCSFSVPDGALSFGPGCTVMFLLVWVLDGPQLAPKGPSLRAQSPYFSWFPLASALMLLIFLHHNYYGLGKWVSHPPFALGNRSFHSPFSNPRLWSDPFFRSL